VVVDTGAVGCAETGLALDESATLVVVATVGAELVDVVIWTAELVVRFVATSAVLVVDCWLDFFVVDVVSVESDGHTAAKIPPFMTMLSNDEELTSAPEHALVTLCATDSSASSQAEEHPYSKSESVHVGIGLRYATRQAMGTKPDERGSKFPSDTALVAGMAANKIAVRRMLKPRSAKTEAALDEDFRCLWPPGRL
jgi:hypothetical protein